MNDAFTGPNATEPIGAHVPVELLSRPQWIAWWSVPGTGCPVQLPNGRLSQSA